MRFVPVKSEAQSDIQALHRARARLIAGRTALINHLRALLLERGIVAPKGRKKLDDELAVFADEEDDRLSSRMRLLVEDLGPSGTNSMRGSPPSTASSRAWLGRRGGPPAGDDPRHRVIDATALVAALGDARSFGRGRDLAAWLGLVPRQATTGGKPRMLGISKRGNRYLRGNLIHGARAVLPGVLAQQTPLGRWARAPSERAHKNVVVVALAAKLARIVWAVLRNGRPYEAAVAAAA